MADPKRIIVTFENIKPPFGKRKAVVIQLVEAGNGFDYRTARVREWHGRPGKLSDAILFFHSHSVWIDQIQYHNGVGASTTVPFGQLAKEAAWKRLSKFCGEFSEKDFEKLRAWKPEAEEADDDYGEYWSGYDGYGSYHSYQTPVAFFRVSGDEVGAKLYLGQLEHMVKLNKPPSSSLEEVLAESEKKPGAEEKPNSGKKVSSAGAADETLPGRIYCPICSVFGCSTHCMGVGIIPGAGDEEWGDMGRFIH